MWNSDIIEIEGIKYQLLKKHIKNNNNEYEQLLNNENKDLNIIKKIKNINETYAEYFKKLSYEEMSNGIKANKDNLYLIELYVFLNK